MLNNIHISGFSDEISSDFDTQLKTVKNLGMNYISIRGVNEKNFSEYSIDELNDYIKPKLDEYSIKVSNVGDLAGYAKKVVDYLPAETTFNSGLKGNEAWYTGVDGNLYSAALADTLILPGETKEIKLVLFHLLFVY